MPRQPFEFASRSRWYHVGTPPGQLRAYVPLPAHEAALCARFGNRPDSLLRLKSAHMGVWETKLLKCRLCHRSPGEVAPVMRVTRGEPLSRRERGRGEGNRPQD